MQGEREQGAGRAIECEEREDGGGSKVLRTRGWGGGGRGFLLCYARKD